MMKKIDIPSGEKRLEPLFVEVAQSMNLRVTVGENASTTILCIQRSPSDAPVEILQESIVSAHARIHWFNVTLGKNVAQTLVSRCEGEGAVSTVDWVFRASGEDRQHLRAENIFAACDGGGEITMRGVAEARAHAKAEGMIAIGEKGTGTHTYLTQHVLMLDSTAKVDAIPGLEIKTNDVKASHSATVSCVSPEELFYFATRGIPLEEARRMYIDGFLGELIVRLPEGEARERVRAALQQ